MLSDVNFGDFTDRCVIIFREMAKTCFPSLQLPGNQQRPCCLNAGKPFLADEWSLAASCYPVSGWFVDVVFIG